MSFDMSQFLQTFYEESFEGLEVMESGLLDLNVGAADNELINSIFRAAHSIKGGSATFGLSDVSSFTHLMETLLDELRDGTRDVSQTLVDLLLKSVDILREMLEGNQSGEAIDQGRVAAMQQQLQQMLDGGAEAMSASAVAVASEASESDLSGWVIDFTPHTHLYHTGNDPVRILRELHDFGEPRLVVHYDKLPDFDELNPEESYLGWTIELEGQIEKSDLDDIFVWVEDDCELTIAPLREVSSLDEPDPTPIPIPIPTPTPTPTPIPTPASPSAETNSSAVARKGGGDSSSIRVSIEKVDAVINLVGELVITQSMLSTLGENFDMNQIQKLRDGLAQLEQNTRELQDDVMRMRMMPISFVFNRFPRMVRDLSQQLGKDIELVMSGEGTELDKTLIENITDPLVHLVRNSVDHGIESATERTAAGKPATGHVYLNAFHRGGNIVIEVKDDGRGLNADKIYQKALERGVIAPDTQLPQDQIYALIFQPGFSTADQVSDVSGRGVGMDVVRRNIQKLGGTVDITSEWGRGSTMTVRLPLTLAILDGQTVSVGEETYIVPLVSIVESLQIKPGMVNKMVGQGETFVLRGAYLPIIRLGELFGIETQAKSLEEGLLVVVEGEGKVIGLFVDDLQGQQQVVIKSLESNYQRIEGISGATILGDGSVALILDIPSLIRMSNRHNRVRSAKPAERLAAAF
ncbi:chemotaxis protein CheA [Ectothiorhodospiraceae bacterium BW-2]|nr:chemotaxis protein CheA [Ectothiorhodospiraceae bacterium BW-2]